VHEKAGSRKDRSRSLRGVGGREVLKGGKGGHLQNRLLKICLWHDKEKKLERGVSIPRAVEGGGSEVQQEGCSTRKLT